MISQIERSDGDNPPPTFPLIRVVLGNEKVVFGYDQFDQFMMVEQREDKRGWSMTSALDVRGKRCVICNRLWGNDPDDMAQVMHIERPEWSEEAGPDGKHKKIKEGTYAHERCYLGHKNLDERHLIREAINRARRPHSYVPCKIESIPNEYGGALDTDWYIVTLLESEPKSKIKFGSRKRVWHVELFSEDGNLVVPITTPEHPLAKALREAKAVNTTTGQDKRSIYLHAWSEEFVYEYVAAMIRLVEKPKPEKPS